MKMLNFYVSFGPGHSHKWQGMSLDKDCLLLVQAPDPQRAAAAADAIFKRGWATLYNDQDLPGIIDLFPRGVINAPRCMLICHDANHNGDFFDGGCGNPSCWKHDAGAGKSPAPQPTRIEGRCLCPQGTFPGELITPGGSIN